MASEIETQDTMAETAVVEPTVVNDTDQDKPAANDKLRWYVVSTRSGHEKKTAQQVMQRVKANGMEDYISDVYVPTQQRVMAKEGKKRTVEERIFPGYILIQMDLNEDTWQLIRYTDGVTGFVGQSKDPQPLSDKEVRAIMKFSEVEQTSYKSSFRVGDPIKVIDGPFKEMIGEVKEINEAKGQVTVLLTMFGREVPTTLDFLQVTSLSDK